MEPHSAEQKRYIVCFTDFSVSRGTSRYRCSLPFSGTTHQTYSFDNIAIVGESHSLFPQSTSEAPGVCRNSRPDYTKSLRERDDITGTTVEVM